MPLLQRSLGRAGRAKSMVCSSHVKGEKGLKNKASRKLVKSAVCAVTAVFCLAQPVWGEESHSGVNAAQAAGDLQNMGTAISQEIPNGAKISSEQAEQVVKKLFPALDKARVVSAEYREADHLQSGFKAWDLQFSIQKGSMGTSFNAKIDAVTGEIVSVYLPRNLLSLSGGEEGTELSREEARKKGLAWIRQNVKSIKVEELTENTLYTGAVKSLFSPVSYDFYYNVSVDGIPSDADTVNMALDLYGNLTTFNRTQMSVKPATSKPKIPAEQIRKKYEEEFTVEMAYVPTSQVGTSKGTYFLAYLPSDHSLFALDAETGKKINYSGESDQEEGIAPVPVPESMKGFQPSSKPLTSGNEAVKRVESYFAIPKEYKANSKTLSQRWNDKETKSWNIAWSTAQSEFGFGDQISAEVNAKTGQIYSYSTYSYPRAGGPKESKPAVRAVTPKEAEQTAVDIVSRLVPNASAEWKLTRISQADKKSPSPRYSFGFARYADGVKIQGESVSVTVGEDGKIREFYNSSSVDLSKLPLTSKPKLSAEEAKAAYLKETELQLKFAQFGGYYSDEHEPTPFYTKLVYSPVRKNKDEPYDASMPLDAVTGEWRETLPGIYTKENPAASDTKGHKSQAALDKLVKYGVLVPDKDGKVYPDLELTAGEWYMLVARALNPHIDQDTAINTEPYGSLQPENPYYKAVQILVSQSWLPYEPDASFSTERKLTRDELSQLLTKILKYEKLARSFTTADPVPGASDSSAVIHRGAAIIAVKLGLLPVVDGKFMPDDIVTRAEGAEVLVRLADMAGKSDSFMNEYHSW